MIRSTMSPAPVAVAPVMSTEALTLLFARSRANRAWSRTLRECSDRLVTWSARLRPTPIVGASDASAGEALDGRAVSAAPAARRSVLVVAPDPMAHELIADAIGTRHDIIHLSDAASAAKVVDDGARIDVVLAGSFTFAEAWALEACTTLMRELYDHGPWLPVVLVADTPPQTLRAELLLTGVRAFVSPKLAPDELAAAVDRVVRPPDVAVPTGARVAAVKRIFAVLERTVTQVPALTTLAAMAGMSRSHFSRTFHAVAGLALRDYVRDLRLKRAYELMRTPGMSLTAVAVAAGFYDLPHFNKAFRRRFGMSPTEFRRASAPPRSSLATT